MENVATREALSVAAHANRNPVRGRPGRQGGGQARSTGGRRVMPVEGRGPDFGNCMERGQGMATGASLTGSAKVRKLQTVLHAKAKEEPERRFHALDRQGVAGRLPAWRPGSGCATTAALPGWTGRGSRTSRRSGVDRWLGELSRDLREGTYAPKPVRQVLIPKKQPGELPAIGHSLHTGPGGADIGHARA